eukprot:4297008-Prymnesium_polylepis.1
MLSLTVARMAGSLLSNSFDEEMMEVDDLPCLAEAPPEKLTMLTARDTMSEPVVTLTEKVTVRLLLQLLEACSHNGFPVVRLKSKDSKENSDARTKVPCGMILRQQLHHLLRMRVWKKAGTFKFSKHELHSFLAAGALTGSEALIHPGIDERELDELIDLRPYMDPSPFMVTQLMPLSRVYRLFNEIGVRHLPVLNAQQCLVGIITRKDLQVDSMQSSLVAQYKMALKAKVLRKCSACAAASSSKGTPRGNGTETRSSKCVPERRD